MLFAITVIVNFVFLIAAVWLGVYVVTRSPRSPVAWLTGLTLWSMAGLFMNILLALTPPPAPEQAIWWLRYLMPFWPEGALSQGASGWLQGWLVAPALAFWHHATVLMLPSFYTHWRKVRVIFVYFVAVVAILVHMNTTLIIDGVSGDPLYLNSMQAGPLFLFFLGLVLVITILCLSNLLRSARLAPPGIPKKQYNSLIMATAAAGLVAPIGILGSAVGLSLPMVVPSLCLGIGVIMLGYGVARYSALMEGRIIRRDFIYNVVAVSLITMVYLAVTWLSVKLFYVPASAFIFVVILAVVTHSVIDIARMNLDAVFYQKENRQLRANLRRMASLAGELSLEENLEVALESLCQTVRATYGILVLFEDCEGLLTIEYRWAKKNMSIEHLDLCGDDVMHLELSQLPEPMADAALLVPLYDHSDQIGALVFGRPVNGTRYSATDVDLLLYPSDQLVTTIMRARHESEMLVKLTELTQVSDQRTEIYTDQFRIKDVENALRNLWDYSYLGASSLSELRLVRSSLTQGPVTHLDRGKGVHKALTDAVEKLRPIGEKPSDPPPREWYAYLILYGAYLEDRLNRDIMAQLYISEGTFNRTRRSAIRTITRVLEEMEAALH